MGLGTVRREKRMETKVANKWLRVTFHFSRRHRIKLSVLSLLPFHFSPACRYLSSSRDSSYEKTFQIPVSSIPRRLIVVRSRNQNLGSHWPPTSRKAAIEHSREISDARLYETVIFTIFIPHLLSVNKYMCV